METNREFRFTLDEFRELERRQNQKCYVTGLEITGANAEVELIKPLPQGGGIDFDNICLVIDAVRDFKRYYSIEQIVDIAKHIVKLHG